MLSPRQKLIALCWLAARLPSRAPKPVWFRFAFRMPRRFLLQVDVAGTNGAPTILWARGILPDMPRQSPYSNSAEPRVTHYVCTIVSCRLFSVTLRRLPVST